MSISKKLAAWSLIIAATSCFLPDLFPPGEWDPIIRICLWVALAWFAVLVICLVRYHKRGLWFLVGAPLVLYWPFVLFMIGWACAHDVHKCP